MGDLTQRSLLLLFLCLAVFSSACGQDRQTTKPDRSSATISPTPVATDTLPPSAMGDMVPIPSGEFTMGASPAAQSAVLDFGWSDFWLNRIDFLVTSAGPAHQIFLDAYHIDRHEVSNKDYATFVQATGHSQPSSWEKEAFAHPDQPVVTVSWDDASAYCNWMEKRLPTEAEWEKAARGTDGFEYPWGNAWEPANLMSAEWYAQQPLEDFETWSQWQYDTKAGPATVGSFPQGSSPYGVMDLAGNVWEWVADWYNPNYYAISPARNPTGPAPAAYRVLRGGAWDVPRVIALSWFRETFIPPDYTNSFVTGFRCAIGSSRSVYHDAARDPAIRSARIPAASD